MKAIILILALAGAHAPPSDDERSACKPDALRFCLGYALTFNVPGVVHCLAANRCVISQACHAVLKQRGIINGECHAN